ncbi:Zn-dependent hydrolase [Thalassovita aquimarina]|uniref:Zn-dependent hydrolase n=1 Tax=Thalassovita aquimarina TaxID=2785917 RepID=A0ABS5HRH4_9RHOB|nr:Zn-dependent hydrolase [Thalassovita aquimarina]MBR9651530.1 Zn-dependent hydrolase [Thalassovita aquimarina]
MTQCAVGHAAAAEHQQAAEIFSAVYRMSRDRAGVSRPAYSETETAVLKFLEELAVHAGLSTAYDAGQNLVMSLPEDAGAEQFVLVGSHVDSVPMGGNYDGMAGVIAGVMCLLRAKARGERFARSLKVIAMRGEESAWFGPCYIASKALMGVLSREELAAPHKGDGRSLDTHMEGAGIEMAPIRSGVPLMKAGDILEYIELHIEQGPLLIGKDRPAAIVSGIRGNFRYKAIRCTGEAGHSGAVPRAFRKDPVLAMSDLLTRLDEAWLSIVQKGGDLVVTSGVVHTDSETNAMSRIPDQVDFSLDIRSQDPETLRGMRQLLADEMAQISHERKVTFATGSLNATAPARMSQSVVDGLSAAMERIGLAPMVMASGGGHDAAVFANAGVPSAMVFVRNQNGSHNPDEAMEIDDFMAGTSIIYEYLRGGARA